MIQSYLFRTPKFPECGNITIDRDTKEMMIKRFSAIVIVFSIISITRDVDGTINLDIINELVAPENPELNRVRRMEDADGDPFAVLDTVSQGLMDRFRD